nr:cationic amino acid transporter 1-like [Tanacetum cinerariifolium]
YDTAKTDEKQWSKVEGGQMKNGIENKDGDDK